MKEKQKETEKLSNAIFSIAAFYLSATHMFLPKIKEVTPHYTLWQGMYVTERGAVR